MKKKIMGKKAGNICENFTGRHTQVPDREVIWLKPYTASKRQVWTRTASFMKAGTLYCFVHYKED